MIFLDHYQSDLSWFIVIIESINHTIIVTQMKLNLGGWFQTYKLRIMSYRANLDIVIALNNLQITSFRKQGYLRFKLTLLQRTNNTLQSHKKKV